MKNIIVSLAVLSVVVISFSSCITTNKGFQSSPVMARYVELDPIKADIVVDEVNKLKGESSSTYFLIFRISGDNTMADGITYSTDANASLVSQFNPLNMINQSRLLKVRGSAAYNALKDKDYDVLVHPCYTITTENYLIIKKYTVSVEGYGAKYTNFRTEKQKIIITGSDNEYVFPDGE